MSVALWTAQGVLAAVFFVAGTIKLVKSHDALKADPHMRWSHDFSAGFIKFIATAEVAGAVGMVVPGATGIVPVATPVAATGLFVLMVGATVVHLRLKEMHMMIVTDLLGLVALFVAIGRFVLLPL